LENGSESFYLVEGLKKVSSLLAVKKILKFFAQMKEGVYFYKNEDIIKETVSKAVSFYKNGHKELYTMFVMIISK